MSSRISAFVALIDARKTLNVEDLNFNDLSQQFNDHWSVQMVKECFGAHGAFTLWHAFKLNGIVNWSIDDHYRISNDKKLVLNQKYERDIN